MSSNLRWKPISRDAMGLPDALKYAFRKRYGESVSATLGMGDISYLEGLRDAGIAGADEVIKAIEKHEGIEVFEER